MKIIKNINNNYAIAVDSAGKSLIVSGKGIGFGSVPREITDLNLITRSYYDIDPLYISMIGSIPDNIIDIATILVDRVRNDLNADISSNIIFTLADHINFAINRYQKKMNIQLSIIYDIEYLFEKEYAIGLYSLKLIEKYVGVKLPRYEAAYVALHIINAEEKSNTTVKITDDKVIEHITKIMEQEFNRKINLKSFNYSRFVSHIQYLIKRSATKHIITSDNDSLFITMKESYPKTYECALKISDYLEKTINTALTDEEVLYLMLHINRLCTREDYD